MNTEYRLNIFSLLFHEIIPKKQETKTSQQKYHKLLFFFLAELRLAAKIRSKKTLAKIYSKLRCSHLSARVTSPFSKNFRK